MWYNLILMLALHQELRYLFSYYYYVQMSSYQLEKKMTFFPCHHHVIKMPNKNQIICCSLYLSRSEFLVNFTDLNKQLPNVKSVFRFVSCGFSL